MNRILVAYDGTAESEAALRLDAELATTLGAAVWIARVASTPSCGPHQPSADVWISERELFDTSERLGAIGSHAEIYRATGDPASEIDRIAADNDRDAIAVGRRGLSTVGPVLRPTASDRFPAKLPPTVRVVGPAGPSPIRA